MFHSAILDTRLHKYILKFMLKIISVRHYKKQSILILPLEGTSSFVGYYDEGFETYNPRNFIAEGPNPVL